MYAVIFTAEIKQLDDDYSATAQRMRDLALSEFGCLDFTSACEGGQEIAISYWPSLEAIQAWKQHPEHKAAQAKGRSVWYARYDVKVVEVLRAYASPGETGQ